MSERGASKEAKGVAVNALTLGAQAAMPAFHVQLARVLGAHGYGLYAWSNMVVDLLSVATLFGMDQAVNRRVAEAHARGDDAACARATGAGLRVVLLSGALVTAAIWALAPTLAGRGGRGEAVLPLRLLSLVPVFFHGATILLVATQARLEMRYDFFTRGLFQPLALLALTTLALRTGGTVGAACLAVATAMGLTFLFAGACYARELPLRETVRATLTAPMDWGVVRAALPVLATGLMWSLSGRIDALYVGSLGGAASMGAYNACLLYVASISQTRSIFVPVVLARIPEALAKDDRLGLVAVVARQTRWCALVTLPLAVLFGGLGAPLLAVFGRGFVGGATAMAVLSVGHLVSALSLSTFALPMSGRGWWSTASAGVSVLGQLLLLPYLIGRFGLTGAAISSAGGICVAQVAQSLLAWRLVGVHGLSRGLAKAVAAALLALALGRGLYELAPALPMLARFAASVAVAALAYGGALAALGLDPEDREIALASLAALRARLRRQR